MRDKKNEAVVREIIKILDIDVMDVINKDKNAGLGRCFMAYVFDFGLPELNDEQIHINMWNELRTTPAAMYWLKQCAKQYGLSWAYEKLNPTYNEKTELMSEVLGGKDGLA